MTRASIYEYDAAQRPRYQQEIRTQKRQLLDERPLEDRQDEELPG